jgi:hypothetical protein
MTKTAACFRVKYAVAGMTLPYAKCCPSPASAGLRLICKGVPIVSRQLSKPEELREAGLRFTFRYGRAGPVRRFISPEIQDAAGHDKLLGEPLPQPPRDQIGDPLSTLGGSVLG